MAQESTRPCIMRRIVFSRYHQAMHDRWPRASCTECLLPLVGPYALSVTYYYSTRINSKLPVSDHVSLYSNKVLLLSPQQGSVYMVLASARILLWRL